VTALDFRAQHLFEEVAEGQRLGGRTLRDRIELRRHRAQLEGVAEV
jgi:hypothetical protein